MGGEVRKIEQGTRVVLCGGHPWAGAHGVFDRWEYKPSDGEVKQCAVILLDNGMRTVVCSPNRWRPEWAVDLETKPRG